MTITQSVLNTVHHGDGITKQSNWPESAEFGIEYQAHDRQFPNVNHNKQVKFFGSEEELNKWFDDQLDWVRGTDYDFSITYTLYRWNLGPEFMRHSSF